MTLKEKFENVEIMFESQTGKLKYDELCEASNECVKIAKDYANEQIEKICESEVIQRIRATKSDAEARRIIRNI